MCMCMCGGGVCVRMNLYIIMCVSGRVHKYYRLIAVQFVYNPTYMLIEKALYLLRSVRIRHKTQSL